MTSATLKDALKYFDTAEEAGSPAARDFAQRLAAEIESAPEPHRIKIRHGFSEDLDAWARLIEFLDLCAPELFRSLEPATALNVAVMCLAGLPEINPDFLIVLGKIVSLAERNGITELQRSLDRGALVADRSRGRRSVGYVLARFTELPAYDGKAFWRRFSNGCVNQLNKQGRPALVEAALSGDPVLVRLALKNGADTAQKDIEGKTALYYAVVAGNWK